MAIVLIRTSSKFFAKENNRVSGPLKVIQGLNDEMLFVNEIQAHDVCKYLQKKKIQISLQTLTRSHQEFEKNGVYNSNVL